MLNSNVSDVQMSSPRLSAAPSENQTPLDATDPNAQEAQERVTDLVREFPIEYRKRFFAEQSSPETRQNSKKVVKVLLEIAAPSTLKMFKQRADVRGRSTARDRDDERKGHHMLIQEERRAIACFHMYKHLFPENIWSCCSKACFANNAHVIELVQALSKIHAYAKELHCGVEDADQLVGTRRKGIGCSSIAYVAPVRGERERESCELTGTERQKAWKRFSLYVESVLPFLSGTGTLEASSLRIERRLCSTAISCLLQVSLNFLYKRKQPKAGSSSGYSEDIYRRSVIDRVGTRQRQFRNIGDRTGYPSIAELKTYKCGCEEPCFAGVEAWRMERQYDEFVKACGEDHSRQKANQFLLNNMFYPLSNSTVKQCDRSISRLFTVSEGVVGAIRQVLKRMCTEPSLEDRPLQPDWWKSGYASANHPANRIGADVRNRIENHLHMVLRPDPAGGNGISVCRVYSPEVNTHDKLRKLLESLLNSDKEGPVRISASSLHRKISDYMKARNLRISFQQTDHNACPTCKTLRLACFQYFKEHKHMQVELTQILQEISTMASGDIANREKMAESLKKKIEDKKYQEKEVLANFQAHRLRDRDIRGKIKKLSDFFRSVENQHRKGKSFSVQEPGWCSLKTHGMITHQDDMTKVDLPYFVESSTADITRWRFDVNAHVSSVNGDAIVFSHEQGTGAKNASLIFEEILLDHILRCRGESIKVMVSDNASVGKNWLTTVALPQYFVDQGFTKIALVIFLENNHGKWLADMLFGQLQTRRKRTDLLSIDDLLSEFEAINRENGRTQGFALNPLGSIDFSTILESLGYGTKPPKDFCFTRRNIHFACAAAAGAKNSLPRDLKKLLEAALPDDPGMVRICSSPPSDTPQHELPYEDRYFDVPACPIPSQGVPPNQDSENALQISAQQQVQDGVIECNDIARNIADNTCVAPLVVPLNLPFSKSGNGLVPYRTADHVGFNGYRFRGKKAFPELQNHNSDIVRRAWPAGLIRRGLASSDSSNLNESGTVHIESLKCAPENWLARRPIRRIGERGGEICARYPPRNLLNAKHKKGPRESARWIPTSTYREPPVPLIEGTCALEAMKRLSKIHDNIAGSIHFLDILRVIFEVMGQSHLRQPCDEWLHNPSTRPSESAIKTYCEELKMFVKREKTFPKAVLCVKNAFKRDSAVIAEIERNLEKQNIPVKCSKARNTELNKMFEELESQPGGLDRFEYLVERNLERFSRDLEQHRRKQREFDEKNNLLPTQRETVE